MTKKKTILLIAALAIGCVLTLYFYGSHLKAEADHERNWNRMRELLDLEIEILDGRLGYPAVIIDVDAWFHFMEQVELQQPDFVILSDRGNLLWDIYVFNANYTIAWHFDLGYLRWGLPLTL